MGWIPHKMEVLGDPTSWSKSWSKSSISAVEQINHLAFSKPEIEHLAFLSMNPKCMCSSVHSYSHGLSCQSSIYSFEFITLI